MQWLGIDVGGANVKLSNGSDYAESIPFALWKHPEQLADALRDAFGRAPTASAIAATMTGELADCYETKADGVRQITRALEEATGERTLAVYGVDGTFHSADAVCETPLVAAASNWHALARFASQWLPERTGLVIDIGSTTTDIVPVRAGAVATSSQNDADRLLAGELVYTGIGRTPICATVDHLPYRGALCPVAAELFATTGDVYFLLGLRPPAEADVATETADGRAMNEQFAFDRLARQICADRTTFSRDDALVACRSIRDRQLSLIGEALSRVLQGEQRPSGGWSHAIVSGSGEFLAHKLFANRQDLQSIESLAGRTSPVLSACAAAAAVVFLAVQEA